MTIQVSRIGHAQVAVIAAGDEPVAGADALPGAGRGDSGVVDPASGDELAEGGGVELSGLLAAVDHQPHALTPGLTEAFDVGGECDRPRSSP